MDKLPPVGHFHTAWSQLVERVEDGTEERWVLLPGFEEKCRTLYQDALAKGLKLEDATDGGKVLEKGILTLSREFMVEYMRWKADRKAAEAAAKSDTREVLEEQAKKFEDRAQEQQKVVKSLLEQTQQASPEDKARLEVEAKEAAKVLEDYRKSMRSLVDQAATVAKEARLAQQEAVESANRHRLVEFLGLRPDVVFPNHLAGARLQGDDEAATGAATILGVGGNKMLVGAAAENNVALGQDGRGKNAIGGVCPGKRFVARVDLPAFLAGGFIECVDVAARIADINRVKSDQRAVEEAGRRQGMGRLRNGRHSLRQIYIPVDPFLFAVRTEFVKRRHADRAEVDAPFHRYHGMHVANLVAGIPGGGSAIFR